MKGYGQYCPVAKAAEVFAERWTPLILRELLLGSSHFSDLHRGVPLMSRSLLSLRLKQLEEIGVVERRQGRVGSEYYLTQAGREFGPMIRELGEWGQRWYRPKFHADELDVGLLMWDMRRCVNVDAFPSRRISVQFDFTGVPASKRTWWLVSDEKGVDLCPTDPGIRGWSLRCDGSANDDPRFHGGSFSESGDQRGPDRAQRPAGPVPLLCTLAWVERIRRYRGCQGWECSGGA